MAIPNKQSARKIAPMHGVDGFLSTMIKSRQNAPATLNKFSVSFATPPILRQGSVGGNSSSSVTTLETGTAAQLLDYYANSVSLPSRQVTTSQFQPPGASVKYATNQSFSEMNIEFTIPKTQYTRAIFETWVNRITQDSSQYVDFYDRYCSPRVRVYKWETSTSNNLAENLQNVGELTGCWEMRNVYPYNIGTIQLTNEQNTIMRLQIGFYYERYRFYAADAVTDPGQNFEITVPAGQGGGYDATIGQEGSTFAKTFTVGGIVYDIETRRPINLV